MKVLKNKEYELDFETDALGKSIKKFTVRRFAKVCLNNVVKQSGVTPQEMSERLKVLAVFDKEEKEYKLEDAQAAKLKECVNAMSWNIVNKDIVDFNETIEKI